MMAESYNEYLRKKIYELFPEDEAQTFMEESDKARPTTIRANTLLKRRKDLRYLLSGRGVDLEDLPWIDTGMVVFRSSVPIGATPEYLAGYYCLQGASSFLPVLNLELRDGLVVLDMCAAPGGKSSHIAALMNNTGVLYANDSDKERIPALRSNLQRMNVRNCIVTNFDGRKINMRTVDRVLLDAPCSGTGVISKDPSIKTGRTHRDISKLVALQKALILSAFDLLNPGGVLVYSTCSVLVNENEDIVNYLLKKRPSASVRPCDVDVGRDGLTEFTGRDYHPDLKYTRRVYPHVHNMDGFYYAKIKKKR
jgi:25S rRNA (cytosine2870-C5)-methyltransferase